MEGEGRPAQGSAVTFRQALLTLGMVEVETVAKAQAQDPDAADKEKMAMTKVALEAIEAYVAALFGVSMDEVREGLASIPAADIEQAMRSRIMHAMN